MAVPTDASRPIPRDSERPHLVIPSSDWPTGNRPLLVDFSGLPGAGKTTIARALVSRFEKAGLACCLVEITDYETLRSGRFASVSDLWRSTGLLLLVLGLLAVTRPRTRELLGCFRRLYMHARYVRACALHEADVVLLDRSVINSAGLIAVRTGSLSEPLVRRIFSRVYEDLADRTLFVHVRTPESTAAERFASRRTREIEAGARFPRVGADRVFDGRPMRWCFELAGREVGGHQVEVDGTLPPRSTASSLQNVVSQLVTRGRAAAGIPESHALME
jgi:thymidylate kinase